MDSKTPIPSRGVINVLFRLLAVSLALLLGACKIEIIVPANGKVVSRDGDIVCNAGERCVIEVTDTTFDERFVAMPADGFIFSHWRGGERRFCGGNRIPCHLFTSSFPGTPLAPFLETDDVFFLQPVFVPMDHAWWFQTLGEIRDGTHATDDFLYQIVPNVEQCDPGMLTVAATERALEGTNQIRALHGLPAVDYDDFYDTEMAQAALVQIANNYLSHFPQSGDLCFTESAAEGARTSNLGLGPQGDPVSDVIAWTNDNTNVALLAAAGHRRWVLSPTLGEVSYGQVQGASSLKVFGFNRGSTPLPDIDYIAMPSGIYPYVLVSQGRFPTPWSLTMVPDSEGQGVHDYFSQAEVSISTANGKRDLVVHSLYSDTDNFGVPNFLSWMVDNWKYDEEYRVTVSNVRMPNGMLEDIEYSVVVDRYNFFDVNDPLEGGDARQGQQLSGNFDGERDRDSYLMELSGNVEFRAANGFASLGFFVLVYDEAKRLVASFDEATVLSNLSGEYTVSISTYNDDGSFYPGDRSYSLVVE